MSVYVLCIAGVVGALWNLAIVGLFLHIGWTVAAALWAAAYIVSLLRWWRAARSV